VGVVIVEKEGLGEVLGFLNGYNVEVYTRDIILTFEGEKELNKEGE
jgi:uncharacterized membrane protein (Fun14 family)